MSDLQELTKELMNDPSFREEYNSLRPETKYAEFYHHIQCAAGEDGLSIDDELEKIRSYGIRYVEIDRDSIGAKEEDIRNFSKMLERHDMEPSSIYGFYSWEKGCGDISADDLIIRQAQIMGSKRIMIIPGFYTELDNKIKCDTELGQMIEGMQKLVGYATSAGLTSTIEDFDSKTSPIATMSGMSIFLDAVPDLYVTLDTGNFFFYEEDSFEATLLFRNRIRHVHLKDRFLPSHENNVIPEKMVGGEPVETVFGTVMMPCPVGYGHMPIAKIMDVLKQDAYDGVFSIEHFGVSSFSKTILDSLNWLKGRQQMA